MSQWTQKLLIKENVTVRFWDEAVPITVSEILAPFSVSAVSYSAAGNVADMEILARVVG